MQNSAFKAFAISPNDVPRLIGEFSKLKKHRQAHKRRLKGDIDNFAPRTPFQNQALCAQNRRNFKIYTAAVQPIQSVL